MTKEIWKIHEKILQVSSKGRFRKLVEGCWVDIEPKIDPSEGYLYIPFTKDKKGFIWCHRLVALLFVPNDDPAKRYVDHIDNNIYNNAATNLQWLSLQENLLKGRKLRPSGKRKCRCVETGKVYSSMAEASQDTGVRYASVSASCRYGTCNKGLHFEEVQ